MINPSLNFYPEVVEFVATLRPTYYVHYFAMGRLYRDGRHYVIMSNPSWAVEHLALNKHPPAGLLNFDNIEGKQLLFRSENYDQMLGWSEGTYLAAREKFNIKNILTIMDKKHDYIDQYMIDIHHTNVVDIYLNHLGYVEDFFNSLKDKFGNLISCLAKDPLIFDVQYLAKETMKKNKLHCGNKYSLYYNGQLVELSRQEYTCLEHLAKGERPKEIARNLSIALKTVETYLGRAKLKLNIESTSGIIKCYWNNVDLCRIY